MLNLGLGVLVKKEESSQVLSYEYLDTVMMYNEACEELTIVCDQFDQVCTAYENLVAISDVIKEHGVTPALESLVGENFVGGFSLESAEEAKEGAWEKIKAFIVRIWEAIKNFFDNFWTMIVGQSNRLQSFVEKAKSGKYKLEGKDFHGVKFGGVDLSNYIAKLDMNTTELKIESGNMNFGENVSAAADYALKLRSSIDKAASKKGEIKQQVDNAIKDAKSANSGDKEKLEELKKQAVRAQTVRTRAAKALASSASQFLANNKLVGKGDDKPAEGKPAEGDAKPAENAEAGKKDEGKTE